MKKVLSAIAILSLISGQAFAQATPSTPATPTEAPATPANVAAPNTGTGLSVPAMVSIGVALAAVAAVASDNSTTTTHH